jgi:hypothetical protein
VLAAGVNTLRSQHFLRENYMQLYVKLRGAIFAENGYCLDAPHLRKDATGFFSTLSADGKVHSIEDIPGCEGDCKSVINVTLRPYPNPAKALEALQLMCYYLGDAVKGDAEARELFAAAWKRMVFQGMALTEQDGATKFALLKNLYGNGRVIEDLNCGEVAACLAAPDAALVAEALSAPMR